MDITSHNREAWNRQSVSGSRWSQPVSEAIIGSARAGDWGVILTPNKIVPKEWFGEIAGKRLLGLASGGGQQVPILAAAGASVVSFDNSDEQLAKDRAVAERDSLDIDTVRGDMADLSCFEDGSFDIIFHPVSNVFAPDVKTVWNECYRVLKNGGRLMSGFMNPAFFLFDHEEAEDSGELKAQYTIPFSDLTSLSPEKLDAIKSKGYPFEFGHTLQDQIGGQIASGFSIQGFYEDNWDDKSSPLNKYMNIYIATLAVKH